MIGIIIALMIVLLIISTFPFAYKLGYSDGLEKAGEIIEEEFKKRENEIDKRTGNGED